MYVSHNFKLEVLKDTPVPLRINEIYLKPYFEYYGGQVVGLSEAVTNAFDFMLSSVFSQYAVLVMPTEYLQTQSLSDIV